MKHQNLYITVLIISILCLILSIVIQVEKTQFSIKSNNSQNSNLCSAITGANGCEAVQTSIYGQTLGIDNPIYGLIGFALLIMFSAILLVKNVKIIQLLWAAGGLIAGLIALRFLYIQAFTLHTYCVFCVIVDIFSLILLGLAIYQIMLLLKFKHK